MKTSPRLTRRGFTAAELTIGMLITTLVAAAGGALMLAVSQGWTHVTGTSMAQVQIARTNESLEQLLRGARMIGRYRAGTLNDPAATPAAVLVWREDLAPFDGIPQFDELAVVEYDGTKKQLVLYRPEFETEAARAAGNTNYTTALLSLDGMIEVFKDSQYSTPYALNAEGELTGCCFNVVAANNKGSKPSFEFTLQFTAGGRTTMQYGTATLRSPTD